MEDITNLGNRAPAMATVDRPAFDAVYARLGAAGYRLVPETEAWTAFSAARAAYADRLEAMAAFWVGAVGLVVRRERPAPVADAPARQSAGTAADEATRQTG